MIKKHKLWTHNVYNDVYVTNKDTVFSLCRQTFIEDVYLR